MYPTISFTFQGWCNGATVKSVFDTELGKVRKVYGVSNETLIKNLQSGKWTLLFSEVYKKHQETGGNHECELGDFDNSMITYGHFSVRGKHNKSEAAKNESV